MLNFLGSDFIISIVYSIFRDYEKYAISIIHASLVSQTAVQALQATLLT